VPIICAIITNVHQFAVPSSNNLTILRLETKDDSRVDTDGLQICCNYKMNTQSRKRLFFLCYGLGRRGFKNLNKPSLRLQLWKRK
jgi:hypothetical protein